MTIDNKLETINLTRPSLDQREIEAATVVLRSDWLIRGKNCVAFEGEFAKFAGAKYAVATNGCTMALYLALLKLGLKPGDEVIVPSLTWSATAAVVVHAGGTPVFADVRLSDWCLDPADVARKITKETKAIIPVHFAGRYAGGFEKFKIPLIYDSAHRIEKNDFKGKVSCHSFYAVKNMTTIRGGMILTNSQEDWKFYQKACHGGLSKDTLSRYQGRKSVAAKGEPRSSNERDDPSSFYYEVEFPSWNFDMTDVEAAIGREQLRKVLGFNKKREAVVKKYNNAFGIKNTGNHIYPILVENRDEFLVRMRKAGIQCGIHYLPLHTMRGFKKYYKGPLKSTEFIGKRCVTLPLFSKLAISEINHIIRITKKFAKFSKI